MNFASNFLKTELSWFQLINNCTAVSGVVVENGKYVKELHYPVERDSQLKECISWYIYVPYEKLVLLYAEGWSSKH
jgi:hypothetical protein